MPPAFLNHRVPTACGTPTPTAASSLAVPAAIAAQNRRRSSRPATGGRPGENKRTRPERSERRFRMFIATPVKVLRRPLESANLASVTMKEEAGEAFTTIWRSASQPTDSWSPNGVRFPPQATKSCSSRRLPYPRVIDPADPPIRAERHIKASIATIRISRSYSQAAVLFRDFGSR